MRVTIKIACDNDAFADYPDAEVSRILMDLARRVRDGLPIETTLTLRDINGNKVGELTCR